MNVKKSQNKIQVKFQEEPHSGIFPTNWLQTVDGSKNSILTWITKPNLFTLV